MVGVARNGGEGGSRTHGPVTRTPVFETGTFGHSVTSPLGREVVENTVSADDFQSKR